MATALPAKADRLMKLRREIFDSRKPEARSTRVPLTTPDLTSEALTTRTGTRWP